MIRKKCKKYLLIVPVLILTMTLYFLDYTIDYFKNMAYTFVYHTNVGSVQRFSKELDELYTEYPEDEYNDFYTNMIFVYSKTLGEKDSIITFLMDEEFNIYYSNDPNKRFLETYLNEEANLNLIKYSVDNITVGGEVILSQDLSEEKFYYHKVSNGENAFYIFMCIDRQTLGAELEANEIVIPVCLVGLLLLVMTEYTIFLKMTCVPKACAAIKGNQYAD